jgi:hypothetical protein
MMPKPVLVFAGCLLVAFATTAVIAYLYRGHWLGVLLGIFVLTMAAFMITVQYLAQKYGAKMARRGYSLDDTPQLALFAMLGIVVIFLEGGVVYCIGRHLL